ncbi:hypothetical protein SAMN05443572_103412 [Myxococcus fulvus]|uniref:Lipoprotein n=1 Tax=Myxococcus fulvus TaxID=33 RepID=A0ABY1C9F4_MYXFU|nr:hypothetical protein SAMN05443572_103412 [Myxococcus fulvus]
MERPGECNETDSHEGPLDDFVLTSIPFNQIIKPSAYSGIYLNSLTVIVYP